MIPSNLLYENAQEIELRFLRFLFCCITDIQLAITFDSERFLESQYCSHVSETYQIII